MPNPDVGWTQNDLQRQIDLWRILLTQSRRVDAADLFGVCIVALVEIFAKTGW